MEQGGIVDVERVRCCGVVMFFGICCVYSSEGVMVVGEEAKVI